MELRACYRQIWSDEEGYADSDEQIGYMVVDTHGRTIAYGESKSEAWENALEVQWPLSRQSEEDQAAGAVVAR